MNLKCFNKKLARSPQPTPILIEIKVNRRKSPKITKGVEAVNVALLSSTNPEIVVNRIIATASLTIPSPKTKLKSLGCSSYLMIEIAAMTSEEQSRELTSMQYKKSSLNGFFLKQLLTK